MKKKKRNKKYWGGVPRIGYGFYAFKKVFVTNSSTDSIDAVAKLWISPKTKRVCHSVDNLAQKFRAASAKVIWIKQRNPINDKYEIDISSARNWHGMQGHAIYCVGEVTHADYLDEDRSIICSHGIHFFMSQEKAERYPDL